MVVANPLLDVDDVGLGTPGIGLATHHECAARVVYEDRAPFKTSGRHSSDELDVPLGRPCDSEHWVADREDPDDDVDHASTSGPSPSPPVVFGRTRLPREEAETPYRPFETGVIRRRAYEYDW